MRFHLEVFLLFFSLSSPYLTFIENPEIPSLCNMPFVLQLRDRGRIHNWAQVFPGQHTAQILNCVSFFCEDNFNVLHFGSEICLFLRVWICSKRHKKHYGSKPQRNCTFMNSASAVVIKRSQNQIKPAHLFLYYNEFLLQKIVEHWKHGWKNFEDNNPLTSSSLVILFGVVKQFGRFWLWSETECKIPAEYGLQNNPPPPQTLIVCINCTFSLGRGGGEVREKIEGQQYKIKV